MRKAIDDLGTIEQGGNDLIKNIPSQVEAKEETKIDLSAEITADKIQLKLSPVVAV